MYRFLRRAANRLRSAAQEARLLGAGTLKRRLYGAAGKGECEIRLAGAGPITIRLGDTDLASFVGIFGGIEYDFPIPAVEAAVRARYDAIVAQGRAPVIVDAGAYVGASAIWFSSKFPRAHIVALEPDADSFRMLERNVATHRSVTAIRTAVGSAPGQVRVVPAGGSWATQVERADDGVEITTMNDAFAMVSDGEPLIAKINIEGFEEDVFSANLDWLDRVAMLFIEPHDWLYPGKHTSCSFQKALGDRDFHLFIVGPHLCYAKL